MTKNRYCTNLYCIYNRNLCCKIETEKFTDCLEGILRVIEKERFDNIASYPDITFKIKLREKDWDLIWFNIKYILEEPYRYWGRLNND